MRLPVPLSLALLAYAMAAPLFAEVVFLDDFDTDGASTDFHWYVRGGESGRGKECKGRESSIGPEGRAGASCQKLRNLEKF